MVDDRPTDARRAIGWRGALLLGCIPVALFTLPQVLYPWVGPFSGARYNDPAYAYLFNSLMVAIGETPVHIHHPGTPVQALGAGVIRLHGMAVGDDASEQELIGSVLAAPESFLRSLSAVLLAIVALAAWRLGRRLAETLGGTGYGLIGQAVLLGSPAVMVIIYFVSAEQLLLAATLLLAIATLPISVAGAAVSRIRAMLMGGLFGLGVAIKFTCLPLVALLVALRRWPSILLAVAMGVVAFVLATAPVWSRYGEMLDWLVGIALHAGSYGAGEVGLPPVNQLFRGGVRMLVFEPIIPLTAAVSLVALVQLYRGHARDAASLGVVLAVGLLAIAGVVLLALKAPAPRYLVPAVAVSAVLLPLALKVVLARRRQVLSLLAPAIVAAAIVTAAVQVTSLLHERAQEREAHEHLIATAERLGCFLVPAVKNAMLPYAIASGHRMTCGRFAQPLEALFPGFIYYSFYGTRNCGPSTFDPPGFKSWRIEIAPDALRATAGRRPICLVSIYDLAARTDLQLEPVDLGVPSATFNTERLYVLSLPTK